VRLVRERRHGVPFRVVTNGLLKPEVAGRLKAGGVGAVSVALMTQNPVQYAGLMLKLSGGESVMGHADVCQFVAACSEAGLETECTVVKSPGVRVRDAKELSEALGAVRFRAREYFP